jgi:hypothetical protein
VTESEPQPELVTQLSDIGQVAVLPGLPVADVIVPDVPTRALRSDPTKGHAEGSRILGGGRPFDPLIDQARSADEADRLAASPTDEPGPPRGRGHTDRPPAARRPEPTETIVLVWVVTDPKGRRGR